MIAILWLAGDNLFMANLEKVTLAGGCFWCTEAIQIEFDPKIISFERLLDIFWAIHDPTLRSRKSLGANLW